MDGLNRVKCRVCGEYDFSELHLDTSLCPVHSLKKYILLRHGVIV